MSDYVRRIIKVGDCSRAVVLPSSWIKTQIEKLGESIYAGVRSKTTANGEDVLIIRILKK